MRYDKSELVLDARIVGAQAISVSQSVFTRSCWLLGWSITETTGVGAAAVSIFDGADATGTLVTRLQLPASGVHVVHPGDPGWPIESGLFLAVVSGTITAALVVGEWIK